MFQEQSLTEMLKGTKFYNIMGKKGDRGPVECEEESMGCGEEEINDNV